MDNKQIFARNLQHQMDLARKTRRDLSEALGVSYYTITDWVKAKKYPRMDKVEMIARYFGITKTQLIEDRDHTAEEKETPTVLDGGLSESQQELMNFARGLSEEQAERALQILSLALQGRE